MMTIQQMRDIPIGGKVWYSRVFASLVCLEEAILFPTTMTVSISS